MTEITYRPDEFGLSLTGHAGYSKAGQDIVCAGISALMYAVPASLRNREIRYYLDLNEPDGYVSIKAYPEAEQRYPCTVVFDTVAEGLKLLSDNYPDNVRYTKEAY